MLSHILVCLAMESEEDPFPYLFKVEVIGSLIRLPANDIERSIYFGYMIYISIFDWFILKKILN